LQRLLEQDPAGYYHAWLTLYEAITNRKDSSPNDRTGFYNSNSDRIRDMKILKAINDWYTNNIETLIFDTESNELIEQWIKSGVIK